MFSIETRWNIEQNMSIMKVTAIASLTKVEIINTSIELTLISKMADVVESAEKFKGKPLDIEPNPPLDKDTLRVSSSIIFDSPENLNAFRVELPNILKQE